jgi:cell division septation protein DedD
MAKNGKRGGGDRVLESRHLVLLFLSVVLLCGVFFTLGYVMGHTQYGGAVHAAEATTRPTPAPVTPKNREANPPATSADRTWDEYDPTKKNTDNHIEPAPKPAPKAVPASSAPNTKANAPATVPVSARTPAPAMKAPARYQPPALAKNSIVLQVAAVKQQRDALEMADELQKKKFPAFVVNSAADGFYHVQVGPYADKAAADAARHSLEQAGFKAIIKR